GAVDRGSGARRAPRRARGRGAPEPRRRGQIHGNQRALTPASAGRRRHVVPRARPPGAHGASRELAPGSATEHHRGRPRPRLLRHERLLPRFPPPLRRERLHAPPAREARRHTRRAVARDAGLPRRSDWRVEHVDWRLVSRSESTLVRGSGLHLCHASTLLGRRPMKTSLWIIALLSLGLGCAAPTSLGEPSEEGTYDISGDDAEVVESDPVEPLAIIEIAPGHEVRFVPIEVDGTTAGVFLAEISDGRNSVSAIEIARAELGEGATAGDLFVALAEEDATIPEALSPSPELDRPIGWARELVTEALAAHVPYRSTPEIGRAHV